MENVRLYIPYENAGDLYEAFIEPALSGTMELRGYGAPECFKVPSDDDSYISWGMQSDPISNRPPDYEVLFEVPVNVNGESEG